MSSLDNLYKLPKSEQDAIVNGPAMAAPNGTSANFTNPPNGNSIGEVITPIFLSIVAILVLLRLSSRIFILKKVYIEDVLCILGFASYLGYVWCVYRMLHVLGLYVHQWNVTVSSVFGMLHVFQYFVNFYAVAVLFMKVAILLEWKRMFAPPGTRGRFRASLPSHPAPPARIWIGWGPQLTDGLGKLACNIILLVTVMFYVSIEVAGNLSCRPFQRIWDKRIGGVCFNRTHMDIAVACLNICSHLCILILPQKIIWNLQLPAKKKIGVAVIFAFGIVTLICACFRLAVTVNYSFATDWTYAISPLVIWCLAELTCLFVVFCVPTVPKVFQAAQTWSTSQARSRSGGSKASSGPSPWSSANSKAFHHSSPESYRPLGETALPLESLESARSPVRTWIGHHQGGTTGHGGNEHGILRTMEFSTSEGEEGNHRAL